MDTENKKNIHSDSTENKQDVVWEKTDQMCEFNEKKQQEIYQNLDTDTNNLQQKREERKKIMKTLDEKFPKTKHKEKVVYQDETYERRFFVIAKDGTGKVKWWSKRIKDGEDPSSVNPFTLEDLEKLEQEHNGIKDEDSKNPWKGSGTLRYLNDQIKTVREHLERSGELPMEDWRSVQYKIDKEYPNAKSNDIVQFDGKNYQLKFFPNMSRSWKTILSWDKEWIPLTDEEADQIKEKEKQKKEKRNKKTKEKK